MPIFGNSVCQKCEQIHPIGAACPDYSLNLTEAKMAWFIQPQQIATSDGKPSGRWRMTATSDEGGGGPFGDTTHDHASAEEAQACDRCDEYVNGVAGFPSRKKDAEAKEARERAEYERLKAKFG